MTRSGFSATAELFIILPRLAYTVILKQFHMWVLHKTGYNSTNELFCTLVSQPAASQFWSNRKL